MHQDGEQTDPQTELTATGAGSRGQSPRAPLEQPAVQRTLAVFAIFSVAVIFFAGRKNFSHRDPAPPIAAPLLRIDINQADAREFALLPGIGPVLARRIVDDRTRRGDFANLQNLSRVHGIGQKTIDRVRIYCVPVSHPQAVVALADDP